MPSALPALKPNHPNQNSPAPSTRERHVWANDLLVALAPRAPSTNTTDQRRRAGVDVHHPAARVVEGAHLGQPAAAGGGWLGQDGRPRLRGRHRGAHQRRRGRPGRGPRARRAQGLRPPGVPSPQRGLHGPGRRACCGSGGSASTRAAPWPPTPPPAWPSRTRCWPPPRPS